SASGGVSWLGRNRRAVGVESVPRRLPGALRRVVERARRLVEHEEPRVAQGRAGEGDPLFLPAGEPVPAGPDHGVVTVWEGRDVIVDLRGPGGLYEFTVGRLGAGVTQILRDRGMQQVRILADHPDEFRDVLGPQA